jgi:uncharacterized protein (DUF1684 family)
MVRGRQARSELGPGGRDDGAIPVGDKYFLRVLRKVYLHSSASLDKMLIMNKSLRLMLNRKKKVAFLTFGVLLFLEGVALCGEEGNKEFLVKEKKYVLEWRKDRDQFFRAHQRSPLTPNEKKNFKGLKYYPFDSKYVFCSQIERYNFHINNPKYYATFLTNKGTNKRYIRYGKTQFKLNGDDYTIEVYKSILSDMLFIPFKDMTNGKETYEGGRYIDAEILPGYRMVLDFNMAYHPSCAYNEKFICALPPKENMLEIQIKAGEKNSK